MKSHFLLDPSITFLNFGSFGACPKPVFETYQRIQRELEWSPVQFFMQTGPALIQRNKERLAAYIHCDALDILLVPNPSHAVNLIAKNIQLKSGDEVLTTNLEYGACDKTWDYTCAQVGAHYVRQPITLPLTSEEEFVEELFAGLTDRTQLLFISHVTSATALRFPVEKVVARAKLHGVPVFVDGAHAPGQIPLDLSQLDCDYYTGACHKWMMTPKGSSFLFVKKEHQDSLDPLIVSWGYHALFPGVSQFQDYHQYHGTRDLSAYGCIEASLDFMQEHDWEQQAARCRQLVLDHADRFSALLGSPLLAPRSGDFFVQMLSLEIACLEPEKFKQHLFDQYKIEIPIMRQDDKNYIRFSIQAFNGEDDLDILYKALKTELEQALWIKKIESF